MQMRLCLLVLLAALHCPAEIIDRIAVTVGDQVITESDVTCEIRITAFLNGDEPDFSPQKKRKTADRLVEQTLIRHEMELSRYRFPEASEAEPLLEQVKKERFSSETAYREALQKYRISEEVLRQHLLKQLATLRFIDLRFRPAVQVTEPEIREYYEKRLVPQWENKNSKPAPALDEVRSEIEKILAEEQVDRQLDNWLKVARSQTRIEYKEAAFQ
jgi:peptidyl-prolyl cis-trans isomerase SurA